MSMPQIFICYASKDKTWRDLVVDQLSALLLDEDAVFSDQNIEPGDYWYRRIEGVMREARVALVIVTASFFRSSFIKMVELPFLKERLDRGELRLIPVVAKACHYEDHPWLNTVEKRPKEKSLQEQSAAKRNRELASLVGDIAKFLKETSGAAGQSVTIGAPARRIASAAAPEVPVARPEALKELAALPPAAAPQPGWGAGVASRLPGLPEWGQPPVYQPR